MKLKLQKPAYQVRQEVEAAGEQIIPGHSRKQAKALQLGLVLREEEYTSTYNGKVRKHLVIRQRDKELYAGCGASIDSYLDGYQAAFNRYYQPPMVLCDSDGNPID